VLQPGKPLSRGVTGLLVQRCTLCDSTPMRLHLAIFV
jgi:hypothetical protein